MVFSCQLLQLDLAYLALLLCYNATMHREH